MKERDFQNFLTISIQEYARALVKCGQLKEKESLEEIKNQYEKKLFAGLDTDNNVFYNIINKGNRNVGYLWLIFDEDLLFVREIYIYEKFRYQGYGTKVFEILRKKGQKLNIPKISLSVFMHNDIAKSLYSKIGFKDSYKTMFCNID
jgi:ribosomal protein S18 acetylase RimI-like enzyme